MGEGRLRDSFGYWAERQHAGDHWYGASLGGSLCDTSKMQVGGVRLTSHESKTTQKAQIT